MKLFLTCLLFIITFSGISQTAFNVSGKVLNENHIGIDLALVSIFKATDSILVKTVFSDSDGSFLIQLTKAGDYILRIKSAGFVEASKFMNVNTSYEMKAISLTEDSNVLDKVIVDGSVPFVVRKIDRIVITPDALIASTGSNALEILEQVPGVTVDQNGQILLKGRAGVGVYINDKPSYLSGSELESYLRSLPAGSIKNIEVIENPPAKYEAAGNAGIININIKQSAIKGVFGNGSISYRRSRYNGSNNSLNLNYNTKKISFSTNLNAGFYESFQDLNINRYYLNELGVEQSAFNQNSFNGNSGHYLQGRVGMDIYATDRTTLGVSYKRSHSPGQADKDNTALISDVNGFLLQRVVADNLSETGFDNDLISFYLLQKLDTLGSEISFDADFVKYASSNNQNFKNFQYNSNDSLIYSDQINGEIPSEISIYALKTDYTKPFKDGSIFSTGLKSAFTQTDNEAIYNKTTEGITAPDYNLSNRFLYDEWINAAYLNYHCSIGKVKLQFGLRGEATHLEGNQLGNLQTPDTSFTRTYASLFPTFYMSRPLDSAGIHSLNFSYGRRIERPYFQDLNPFISPLDKFTYYTGNPNLLPTYSHNLTMTYAYNEIISTEISYAMLIDGINETLEIQDGIYYSRPGNISNSQFLTFSLNATIPITTWYTISAYSQASIVHFESELYTEKLNSKGVNTYASLTNSFNFNKGWKVSISARYLSDQVYSQLLIKGYASMNCGIQKSVFKGKGTLRLNANDLFYSRKGDGIINNLSQTKADWNSKYDSRSVTIAFSMRFGKSNSNKKKYKGSGSDSEQNRVKS